MMQFVPYTNEEQFVIRRNKRSDCKQTAITMYYTINKECNHQETVQVVANLHEQQEETDLAVEHDERSEDDGTYICSRFLCYHLDCLLIAFNNNTQQKRILRSLWILPTVPTTITIM